LRRLGRLFDASAPPEPLALLAPLDSGPFAGAVERAAVPAAPPADAGPPAEPPPAPGAPPETPPLEALVQQMFDRVEAVHDDAGRKAVIADLLAVRPADVTHPVDAARLMGAMQFSLADEDADTV